MRSSPAAERRRRGWLALLCLVASGMAVAGEPVLRVGLSAAPQSLDPRFATDAASARLCRLLFAQPVDFDSRFLPIPALLRWEIIAPTRYRFTLQGEAHFSDGKPIRAADVAATYRAVLDPAIASPHRGSLANVAAVEERDERTLDFILHRADPLFPGLLTIGVLPAAVAGKPHSPRVPSTSGEFALAAPPAPKLLQLIRRRDGLRVDFEVVEHETTRVLKLARGELDLLQGNLAPENVAWLAARQGLAVQRTAGTTVSYVGFNLRDGPTADLRVREAVALALDRETIAQRVFHGDVRPADSLLTADHWANAPDVPRWPYDPSRARALLSAAGYGPARPLHLTFKTSSDAMRLRLATLYQAQLAAVGIELEVQSYDWGTFYADIRHGRFALYGLSWVGLQLPDIFRYAFHSRSLPPEGANRGRYASQAVDRLLEAVEGLPDLATRAVRYRELQAELARDLPIFPLWFEDVVVVLGPRVRGYSTSASGDYDGLARVQFDSTTR